MARGLSQLNDSWPWETRHQKRQRDASYLVYSLKAESEGTMTEIQKDAVS